MTAMKTPIRVIISSLDHGESFTFGLLSSIVFDCGRGGGVGVARIPGIAMQRTRLLRKRDVGLE